MKVWFDRGMRLFAWIGGTSLLDESWLNLVSRWVLGFVIPSFGVGLIVLVMGPGVLLSMKIRFDGRVGIFAWIGGTGFLDESWLNLVSGWVLGLMIPGLRIRLVILVMGPCVFLSMKVWFDRGMRIFAWIGGTSLLDESWLNLVT
jgi:hypothetical protein